MQDYTNSIQTVVYKCENCSSSYGPSFHQSPCESIIILVDGNTQCSGCGVQASDSMVCSVCKNEQTRTSVELPLDMTINIDSQSLEEEIHVKTNRQRINYGLSSFDYSDHLSAIALQHSRDMAKRDYFSHNTPEGQDASDRYRKFGHSDRSVGENIAMQEVNPTERIDKIATKIVDGWMESKGHRENILRNHFTEHGIGAFSRSDGSIYITQNLR